MNKIITKINKVLEFKILYVKKWQNRVMNIKNIGIKIITNMIKHVRLDDFNITG